MSYTLIIAEKPKAAKKIAESLAEGKLKVLKKNDVEYYYFERNGKPHIVAPSVGHLFNLSSISKKWFYPVFDYEWKPSFLVSKFSHFSKKYFEVLKELASNANDVIIATDYDTEGEVIGYNILRFLLNRKDAKRMKFSTLTKEELIDSYENAMKTLDWGQLEAGLARHEIDWLWGINLTRALTLSLKNNGNNVFSIISTGRVQGPTLSLLVKREEEIENFKPKPYWQIFAFIKIGKTKYQAIYEEDKIWDKEKAQKVFSQSNKKVARVLKIKRRQYEQLPPPPFNTTDLQTEAYNQFGFSPMQTMDLAESLYQKGIISYPRTSSQKLPSSIGLKSILQALGKLPSYKKIVNKILSGNELYVVEGSKDDPAHPAIYPTKEVPNPNELTPQERKLYDLIVKRFLAAFGEPSIREAMHVILDINGNKFILKGVKTVKEGWREFYYTYVADKEILLPELREGEELEVEKVEILEKKTEPPPRYTQASIIKEMEKRGLGTKATRSEILKTLYDRNYITGKSIKVTSLGKAVVKILEQYSPKIISEELTRKLEEEMENVYNGKKKREEIVEEAKKLLEEILRGFKKFEEKIGKELSNAIMSSRNEKRIFGKCPSCGGDLIIISYKDKAFISCSNYSNCKTTYPLPGNARIKATGKICGKCHTPIITFFRRGKRTFSMCLDPNCPTKASWGENGNNKK
jgi:DNA topoisomerase-1